LEEHGTGKENQRGGESGSTDGRDLVASLSFPIFLISILKKKETNKQKD